MTAEIYNMTASAASVLWTNPLILVELMTVVLAIVTGVAGRFAIVLEDLRHKRFGFQNE